MKFYWVFLFIFLTAAGSSASLAKNAETIYVGLDSSQTMPLVEIRNPLYHPEITQGILKELTEAALAELNLKPVWVILPPLRLNKGLIAGEVTMACHLHESWQPELKDEVYWSQDLYSHSYLLVSKGKKAVARLKDIAGEQVGTVESLIYTQLNEEFTAKTLIRQDGPSTETNIRKLTYGRLNYIVMSNREYSYFKKEHKALRAAPLRMDSLSTKCALSRKASISLPQFNGALDAIRRSGQYEKILKRYQ